MKALTQKQLDNAQCEVPGCDHRDHLEIFLNQRCHPRAGVSAKYLRNTGTLIIECKQCNAFVANIAVARNETSF
jgi:hypothetical protein